MRAVFSQDRPHFHRLLLAGMLICLLLKSSFKHSNVNLRICFTTKARVSHLLQLHSSKASNTPNASSCSCSAATCLSQWCPGSCKTTTFTSSTIGLCPRRQNLNTPLLRASWQSSCLRILSSSPMPLETFFRHYSSPSFRSVHFRLS